MGANYSYPLLLFSDTNFINAAVIFNFVKYFAFVILFKVFLIKGNE